MVAVDQLPRRTSGSPREGELNLHRELSKERELDPLWPPRWTEEPSAELEWRTCRWLLLEADLKAALFTAPLDDLIVHRFDDIGPGLKAYLKSLCSSFCAPCGADLLTMIEEVNIWICSRLWVLSVDDDRDPALLVENELKEGPVPEPIIAAMLWSTAKAESTPWLEEGIEREELSYPSIILFSCRESV